MANTIATSKATINREVAQARERFYKNRNEIKRLLDSVNKIYELMVDDEDYTTVWTDQIRKRTRTLFTQLQSVDYLRVLLDELIAEQNSQNETEEK